MSVWTGKMNYIKRVFHNPCPTPDATVMIETAFQALVPRLIAFNQLSCLDIMKAKAGISWKCGRMIKAAAKNTIDPKTFDRVHFLYKFIAPVERGLWYYFIAQQAQEFVGDWMSLIYASRGCDLPVGGHITTEIMDGVGGDGQTIAHSWGPATLGGVTIGGDNIHVAPGVEADIMYHIATAPASWEHHQTSVNTYMYKKNSNETYGHGAAVMNPGGPAQGTQNFARLSASPLHFLGEDFGISTLIRGGDTRYYDGELQITVRGRPVYPVPVGCDQSRNNKLVNEFLDQMNGTTHGPH